MGLFVFSLIRTKKLGTSTGAAIAKATGQPITVRIGPPKDDRYDRYKQRYERLKYCIAQCQRNKTTDTQRYKNLTLEHEQVGLQIMSIKLARQAAEEAK